MSHTSTEFDHEAAMAANLADLAAFPPDARVWHIQDGGWVEYLPLPPLTIENLAYVLTLVQRDAARPDLGSSQLRAEVRGSVRNAVEAGYEMGQLGELRYLRAVLDGELEDENAYLTAEDLIRSRLFEIEGWPEEEVDEQEDAS
jgi:hypothetical protein